MNEEQLDALRWLDENPDRHVFFTGAAGTGKSFLLDRVRAHMERDTSNVVLVTASTAIAAQRLGGRTLHSALHIGHGNSSPERLISRFRQLDEQLQDELLSAGVILIDEISMVGAQLFDTIYAFLVGLFGRRSRIPRLIMFGDLFQLPPVVVSSRSSSSSPQEEEREQSIYCFETKAWERLNVHTIELKRVMRQHKDPVFAEMLAHVRRGEVTPEVERFFQAHVRPAPSTGGVTRVFPTHAAVDRANKKALSRIAGELVQIKPLLTMHHVVLVGKGVKNKTYRYPLLDEEGVEDKNEIASLKKEVCKDCLADQPLYLKIGAEVLIVRNIDASKGLVNGARAIVHEIDPVRGEPLVELCATGEKHRIEAKLWRVRSFDGRLEARLMVLPLCLAYALTVHKAQGLTIDGPLECAIDESIFQAGMAYTILSRPTSSENLFLTCFKKEAIWADPRVARVCFGRRSPNDSRGDETSQDNTAEESSTDSEEESVQMQQTRIFEKISPVAKDQQSDKLGWIKYATSNNNNNNKSMKNNKRPAAPHSSSAVGGTVPISIDTFTSSASSYNGNNNIGGGIGLVPPNPFVGRVVKKRKTVSH